MTPLFRAQLGRLEQETGAMKKGSSREPGSWKYHFKSGSRIEMPAPGHVGDADKLGSWEVHRMLIDESNKRRSDPGIRGLWPELGNARGDDQLKFFSNGAFRGALEKGFLACTRPHHERRRQDLQGWSPVKTVASMLMDQSARNWRGLTCAWTTKANGN